MNQVELPRLYAHQRDFAFNLARFPTLWGSWGSAKTWALIVRCLLLSVNTRYFGNFAGNRGVIGRFKYSDFRDTTLKDLKELIPPAWIVTNNKLEGLEIIGGAEMLFAHFDDFKVGGNLGWAAIDQLEQVAEGDFDKLRGRVRLKYLKQINSKGQKLLNPLRTVFGVGNTNGNNSWQFNRWERNRLNFIEGLPYNEDYWTLPPLTIYDNPSLPVDYVADLEKLPPKKFRVYALGSWEALEGVILEDYNEAVCVAKENIIPGTTWRKYVGIDHGNASGVKYAAFIAVDPQLNSLLYDEVYGANCQIEEFCREIHERLELHEREMAEADGRAPQGLEDITLWPCDPSMQRKSEDNAAITIVQLYQQHASRLGFSMPLYPAYAGPGSVDAGIDKLNWLLRNCRKGRGELPYLVVNPRCRHWRQDAGAYVWDPNTNKPKLGQSDHSIDATRYATGTIYIGDVLEQFDDEQLSFAEQLVKDMQLSKHPNDMDDYLQYYQEAV